MLADEIVAVGTGLRLLRGGFLQGIERAADFVIRAPCAQGSSTLPICWRATDLVDVENVRRLFFDGEVIHADDDLLLRFDRPLVLVADASAISFCG